MKGPEPQPTPETAHFWEEASKRRLVIQQCQDCGRYYFYPRSFCPHCQSANVEWQAVSGAARLVSYIINRRPLAPFDPAQPLIVAIVELAEGPRLLTNIVGVDPAPENLPLDAALSVDFEERASRYLPVFRLDRTANQGSTRSA